MGMKMMFEWRMWLIWVATAISTLYGSPYFSRYLAPYFSRFPVVQNHIALILSGIIIVAVVYLITEYLVMRK